MVVMFVMFMMFVMFIMFVMFVVFVMFVMFVMFIMSRGNSINYNSAVQFLKRPEVMFQSPLPDLKFPKYLNLTLRDSCLLFEHNPRDHLGAGGSGQRSFICEETLLFTTWQKVIQCYSPKSS